MQHEPNLDSIPADVAQRYERRALERLRVGGYRVTMPRVQVIRALARSRKALSAYQLHAAILDTGGRIDVVSVYRILATLVDLDLAHHIGVVDGYLACHLEGDHGHPTEHLVCRSCGLVVETTIPHGALLATRQQVGAIGFEIEQLKIEVLGLCAPCSVRQQV